MNTIINGSLAAFIALVLSGCVATGAGQNGSADLNISSRSQFVELDNLKAATAILIKKSSQCDQSGREVKSLLSVQNNSAQQINQMVQKNNDLATKMSLMDEEIVTLRAEIDTLKQKVLSSSVIHDQNSTKTTSAKPSVAQKEIIHQLAEKPIITSEKALPVKAFPVAKKQTAKPIVKSVEPDKSSKDIEAVMKKAGTPKETIIIAEPILEPFTECSGKVLVKTKSGFVRSKPITEQKYVASNVKEGDIFTYTAKSQNWYRLKSGSYISNRIVVDLTIQK